MMWGRAEECGHGLSASAPPVLVPRRVEQLPQIRSMRCGVYHTLACSEMGDIFTWGCGITHQLGNRPRDSNHPHDKDADPCDETAPYLISSKQLEGSFVLQADGGAQHSVELAWNGEYKRLAGYGLRGRGRQALKKQSNSPGKRDGRSPSSAMKATKVLLTEKSRRKQPVMKAVRKVKETVGKVKKAKKSV